MRLELPKRWQSGWLARWALLAWVLAATCASLPAQTTPGWLRYAIPPDPPRYHGLPHVVVLLDNGSDNVAPEEETAADELDRGLGHMVAGTDIVLHRFDLRQDAIVLGTTEAVHRARLGRHLPGWTEKPLPEEGFRIVHLRRGIREWYVLQGGSPRAVLWAAFRFAALVAEDQQLPEDLVDAPQVGLRALDAGSATDLLPLLEPSAPPSAGNGLPSSSGFARLLASTGLNTLIVEGDANAAVRVAERVRPYGLRVWVRGMSAEALLHALPVAPNLGGISIRVPKDAALPQVEAAVQAANTQARSLRGVGASVLLESALGPALQPLLPEGTNHTRQVNTEQRAALLRTGLETNVTVTGSASLSAYAPSPLASPSFSLVPAATQAAVFDILPDTAGLLAYPAMAWDATLQTPERGRSGDIALARLLAACGGGLIGRMAAANAQAMLLQPMLQANLYAFGRLAWAPALSPAAVTEEWARQTWGNDARVYRVAEDILLRSGRSARDAGAPFGLPSLTDAAHNPTPADAALLFLAGQTLGSASGIGVDRTLRGTGERSLYPDTFAAQLADPAQCPHEVLLLVHRLPWRHPMPDGKTLTQALYDASFAAASAAVAMVDAWETTRDLVDPVRYAAVHSNLARSALHADIAREAFTEWVQHTSGVPDTLGFVGSHPGRIPAETMQQTGFQERPSAAEAAADPASAAVVLCNVAECSAATRFEGEENVYRVTVGYRDQHGDGTYELLVDGERKSTWAEVPLPSSDGATSLPSIERFTVNGVRLARGSTLMVRVHPPKGGSAQLDFVEITRDPRWN